jgi:hypothetical protein
MGTVTHRDQKNPLVIALTAHSFSIIWDSMCSGLWMIMGRKFEIIPGSGNIYALFQEQALNSYPLPMNDSDLSKATSKSLSGNGDHIIAYSGWDSGSFQTGGVMVIHLDPSSVKTRILFRK